MSVENVYKTDGSMLRPEMELAFTAGTWLPGTADVRYQRRASRCNGTDITEIHPDKEVKEND
ncbi:hypothetical protein [Paenibacillus polymyxa]|uniref:hypothetical protein n=1 Tax=Paenibacillus polymyxa TaxID=1406 RepID=UPI002ED04EB6|nr:hypothetical protein [Paenibacillus polymyxa]